MARIRGNTTCDECVRTERQTVIVLHDEHKVCIHCLRHFLESLEYQLEVNERVKRYFDGQSQ